METWHAVAFLIVTAIALRYAKGTDPGDCRDRILRDGLKLIEANGRRQHDQQRLIATLQHDSGVIFGRKRPPQCGGCPSSLRLSDDLRRGEGSVSIILRPRLLSALKMTSWRPKSTTRRPGFPIETSAFAPRVVRIPVALVPRMTRVISSSSSWGRA